MFLSLATASCVHRQSGAWWAGELNAVAVEAVTAGSTPVEATLSTSRVVRVRDLLTHRVITQFKVGLIRWNDYEEGPPLVLSADAHLLAIGAGDGRIEIRNAMTGTLLRTLRALPTLDYVLDRSMPGRFGSAEDPVTGLAFAGDTLLAATTLDRQVVVWNRNAIAGRGRISISGPQTVPALPSALGFSGNGQMLAAGPDQIVTVHPVPTLNLLTWVSGGRPPRVVALSATGDFVAIATNNGFFSVASTKPRQLLWYTEARDIPGTDLAPQALAVAFGPGDASVAGVDAEGSVVVWQTVTGREEARFQLPSAQTSAAIEIRMDRGMPHVRVAIPAGVYEFAAPAAPPLGEQWAVRRAAIDSAIGVTPVAVSGIVQDRNTGRPVPGIVVGQTRPQWVRGPMTDSAGRFTLGAIRPGIANVAVRCPSQTRLGALAMDTTITVPRGEPLALDLRIDATRCDEPPFAQRAVRLRGLYTAGFEESEFVPCDDTTGVFREIWGNPLGAWVWVAGIAPRMRWPPADTSTYGKDYSRWYVDWAGTLTGPGRYAYGTYQLDVSSIYAVRTKVPPDCRLVGRTAGNR
jgi:hypothetical protein